MGSPPGTCRTHGPSTVMKIWDELKERRITQVVIGYLAAGWLVLAVVDQLVDRQILPELVYRVALVLFVGGIAAALILGWYHGEKGRQDVTRFEILLLTGVTAITLGVGGLVVYNGLNPEPVAVAADFSSGPDPRRIAVMYFDDQSRDGSLSHVADGLTESLIDALDRVGSLEAVSRNGMLQFKSTDRPREEVAAALSAGTVVTGSVERVGQEVRVDVALADGGSGAIFRRARLEYPENELLELNAEVALQVSELLREWLGEEVAVRRGADETSDAAAWALLQRAERARKEAEARLEAQDIAGVLSAFREADELLAEAEARDPAWARPPTLRAQVALREAQLLRDEPAEAGERIEVGLAQVATALGRNPRFAPAFEARGLLRYLRWRFNLEMESQAASRLLSDAEADLQEAVRLDPSLATAWNVLSIIHSEKPDPVSAKLAAQRAYDEDAFLRAADDLLWRLYATSYDLEQFQDANRYCAEGARRFPQHYRFAECELWLLASRARTPDVDRAWALRDHYLELSHSDPGDFWDRHARIIVGGVIARAGMPDSANAVFLAARPTPDIDPGGELLGLEAVFRLQMGETDQALELVKSYLTQSPTHRGGWRWSAHWWWRGLQDHPEFRALIGESADAP